MKTIQNIVFLDFETTGINVFDSDPIEIGAIQINEKLQIINQFSSHIKPSSTKIMRRSSFNTHGYEIDDLNNKPNQREVLEKYFNIFGTDYCFAGWNISFDIPFFRKMCFKNGYIHLFNKIDYHHIDVQTIAKLSVEIDLINSKKISLEQFAKSFKLKRSKLHSALEDSIITYKIYKNIIKKFHNLTN